MAPRPDPRTVATGTAIAGLLSYVLAAITFANIPENPPGDGFAAGLAGIAVILYVVAGTFALVEAGLLYLADRLRTLDDWPRRLLTAGATAGGGAIALFAVASGLTKLWELTGSSVFLKIDPFLVGVVFVPVGIVCSVLGAALQIVDETRAAI